MILRAAYLAPLAFTAFPAAAAQDTTVARLEPVVVEVARGLHRSSLELPFAVTVQTPDSVRPGQRHLGVDETLWLIPGVSVSNRNNPSQDPRISIRGFGARSAFGVRGIRILRDGIPLTLPDGQTPVDYLDLESVGRVEVMRGSASSLYGNAGGGVIDIRTSDPLPAPLSATARGWSGAYRNRRFVGKLEGASGNLTYQGDVSRNESDGYRDYSRQRLTSGFGRIAIAGAAGTLAAQWMGMNTPLALNPGALTRAQFDADPRQADPQSIRKRARKAVTQSQLGLSAASRIGSGEVEATGYAGTRSLDNPLAFAIVDVERTISGGHARLSLPFSTSALSHRVTVGGEIQRQNDLRRNYANCNDVPPPTAPTASCPVVGVERGNVTLDQRELVTASGAYLRDEVGFGDRYTLTASARADAVRFEVRDQLVTATNPDDSGRRPLHAVSPMVGLLIRLSPSHAAYANVSSAFETPTATELGNRPTGTGGINRELQPQRSTTYEVGVKGLDANGLLYNAAVFTTAVHDELIPFDIPASGGRRYFRNAGRTSRRGLELGAGIALESLDIGAAYTFANYRFVDFTVDTSHYAGKLIPGIPRQAFQASAAWRTFLATFVAEATTAGRMFVNDANSESAPGYAVFNVRLLRALTLARSSAELVVGAQNLFDVPYISSVSVNAAAGKFYEPGTQRALYVGLTLTGSSKAIR